MTRQEIGQVLKSAREAKGLTQKQVADIFGRKQQVVGHWETGYSQPDANTLFELCDIYGISVDSAFGKKEASKQSDLPSPETIALARRIEALDAASREFVETCVSFAESRIVRPAQTVSWSAKPMITMKEHVFAARVEAVNERAELKAEAEGVQVEEEQLQETEK